MKKYKFETIIINKDTIITRGFEFDKETPLNEFDSYANDVELSIGKTNMSVQFACLFNNRVVCMLHFGTAPSIVEWYNIFGMLEKIMRNLFLNV